MKTTREARCHFLFLFLSESIKICNCKISNSMSDDGPENHRVPHSLFFYQRVPCGTMAVFHSSSLQFLFLNSITLERKKNHGSYIFFFHFFSFFLMGYKGPFLVESPKFAANPPFFSCYFSSDPSALCGLHILHAIGRLCIAISGANVICVVSPVILLFCVCFLHRLETRQVPF